MPCLVGKDVCSALGIAKSRNAIASLANDEKGVGNTDTLGGAQEVAIISEPGVYALVMHS